MSPSTAFRSASLFGLLLALVVGTASASAPAQSTRLPLAGTGQTLIIESDLGDDTVAGHVYGVLDTPFAIVADTLMQAHSWCEIAMLHVNVKMCAHQIADTGAEHLQFYVGKKQYQFPDNAFLLDYHFAPQRQPDALHVVLSAAEGPVGTRDYRIELHATPEGDGTHIHFHYSYGFGTAARLALGGYLATLGRGKVGFTVVDTASDGGAIYVGGMQGIIERNAMRYVLAIQSHLTHLNLPPEQRFAASIRHWFDLTEHYSRQLFTVNEDDYLNAKQRERRNQLHHQQQLLGAARSSRP